MSSIRESSRTATLRQLSRRSLAAMLFACGTLSWAAAEDGPNKAEINLRLLPPLPVDVGQLSGAASRPADGDQSGGSSTMRLRRNPFVSPQATLNNEYVSEFQIKQVGNTARAASGLADGKPDNPAEIRIIRRPSSTFALRPVAQASDPVASAATPQLGVNAREGLSDAATLRPIDKRGPAGPPTDSVVRQNPWVNPSQQIDNSPTSGPLSKPVPATRDASGAAMTHPPQRFATPESRDAVQHSAYFSLTDRSGMQDAEQAEVQAEGQTSAEENVSADTQLRLRDSVDQPTSVASLLKIAPPTLLQVAAPVQLDSAETDAASTDQEISESENLPESSASLGPAFQEDISPFGGAGPEAGDISESAAPDVQHGDVRSATGRVARNTLPVEGDDDSNQNAAEHSTADHAASDIVVIEQVTRPSGSENLSPAPVVLVTEPSAPEAVTIPAAASKEDSSQSRVPQVYRPQRSLVIDVAAGSESLAEAEQGTDEQTNAAAVDQTFQGDTADVISVDIAQSRAFTPSEPVRRVQLEDRDICEAVLVGNHKLLLIGRQAGTTRLAVWCGSASQPQLYDIQVGRERRATPGSSLESIAVRLTETITATYPNCRVRVIPEGDGLAVTGKASDTRAAREILRLVRSACLKSVSDHLEVR